MYFDQDNNYFDYDNNTIIFDRNNKLYSLDEGFNKGNMFKDSYSKYKNHIYKLKVNNEKDKLLYKIQMYTFALKDLVLYLDVHNNDTSILKVFNDYTIELDKLKHKYESNYGPLCAFNANNDSKWTWISNPWPWDKGGNN